MTTCLGNSCLFGLLCVSFVDHYRFVFLCLPPFGSEAGLWDFIVITFQFTLIRVPQTHWSHKEETGVVGWCDGAG